MPDRPDWSEYLPGSERHSLQDLSELAARLGSPVTYDRRGEVLWMDQFDYGSSNWKSVSWFGTHTFKIVADYPYRGGYAFYLGTDGTENGIAEIHRYLAPPVVNKWGLEVTFAALTNFRSVSIEFRRQWGTTLYTMFAQVDNENSILEILDEDDDFVEVATIKDIEYASGLFHHLKVVADFNTGMYTRILFDQNEYDISDYKIALSTGDAYYFNDILFYFIGRTGETDYCHLGEVIVTANEP